jgi:predicted GNAT family acetyltransferase
VEGQRIYEVRDVQVQTAARGRVRQAVAADRDLVVDWMRRFGHETGDRGGDPAQAVDRRLPAGQFWLWEDGQPVSMTAHSLPVEGVVRVQAVYTPAEKRTHGYAGACVGALSQHLRDAGYRCILYTDLGNPIANALYRRLGYRAVAECLVYRFT